MKKIIPLALVLTLLSMLLPARGFVIKVSSSTTLHVYPGNTIQEAINLAQPRDTIFVHAGTYYENVIVNKTVSLIGENKHTTIIDGGAAQFDVVYVSAHNVTINSFTLQRGGRGIYPDRRGIYVYSSNNINISNNIIRDNVEGIFICISNDNVVRNNSIHANTRNGLWLYGSSNNDITCNTIADSGESGMILQGVCSNNLIFHNNFINDKNYHIATTGESANVWDDGYPSGGNYWSNYNGTDELNGPYQDIPGSDGIGDIHHTIDASNVDRYPLMAPFTTFDAGTWNGTQNNVNVVTNSTVSDFYFNPTSGTFLLLQVICEPDTSAFFRIAIPKDLLWVEDGWNIYVGSTRLNHTDIADDASTYLYFTYTNTFQNPTNSITINGTHVIPEFPSSLVLPLFIITTLLAVIVYRRKHSM